MKRHSILGLTLATIFSFGALAQEYSIGTDTVTIGKPGSSAAKSVGIRGTDNKLRVDPATGKWEFTNDGSIYKKFGSGSGGGSGAFNILTNGGFEDGIDTEWEYTADRVTAVTGDNALLEETSAEFDAAGADEYLRTTFLSVPKGLRGTPCEARIKYTGGDANLSVLVEDADGKVLNSTGAAQVLVAHTIPSFESVFFVCPSEDAITADADAGSIRLVVFQNGATDAAAIVVDEVHFGALIGLVETTLPDVLSGCVTSAGALLTTNSDFVTSITKGATGKYTIDFTKAGLTAAPSFDGITVVDTGGNVNGTYASLTNTSVTITLAVTNTASPVNDDFCFSMTKQGADAKQSVQVYKSIPKVSENVNELSAVINTTGAIISKSVDWISDCTVSNTSDFNCPVSVVLTEGMSCSATTYNDTTTETKAKIRQLNTSSVVVRTFSASTASAIAFTLKCQKQGNDFKMPTVKPVVIGQVLNSAAESGLNNTRIEGCKINNSGAASIDTASGLCAGWVQSVSRTSTGIVDVNFVAGTFSAPPVCSAMAETQQTDFDGASTTSKITIVSSNSSGTAQDSTFMLQCTGKR